jgi:copper chaperone NosL
MNSATQKISNLSRILLLISTLCLVVSIFVPIWRIDLDAPQYPEGLRLYIYSDKLGGDLDIINGLNHYIGMKTLHTEEFIEFSVLPYLIGSFALLSLIAAMLGKRKIIYWVFALFVLFGIVAMSDFWRWEYNYGHHLDPHAAIIVPGMAYQPPLIGFKQLLNFGAFSVPAKGGWLFISSGILLLFCVLIERRVPEKFIKKSQVPSLALLLIFISG